ncbi:hypothetical protein Tco_1430349 [Tanacetum coccineum]
MLDPQSFLSLENEIHSTLTNEARFRSLFLYFILLLRSVFVIVRGIIMALQNSLKHVIYTEFLDQLETELQEAHTHISGFQKEQIRHDDEIALARFRISTLELIIEDIQVRHQSDMKSLF